MLEPAFPAEIGFSNRGAVRVALLCAGVATLLTSIPLGVFTIFWLLILLVSSGFVAVYLYHRRSGQYLSVRAGARIGWMTGLFYFLVAMIVFTLNMAALASRGQLFTMIREQMQAQASSDPSVQEIMRLFESPAAIITILAITLLFMFLLFTFLPMIGGALSAKVLEREPNG